MSDRTISDKLLSKCLKSDSLLKSLTARVCLLIFLNTLCLLAHAESLRFKVLNAQSGLPQNSIRAITQDTNGLMWFATEDGIARYDGQNLKSYRYDPSALFPLNENVANRFLSLGQQLWISTQGEGGVTVLDQAKQDFIRVKPIPGSSAELALGNVVFSLYQKSASEMYVGSENGVFNVDIESLTITERLVSSEQLNNKRSIAGIWEDPQRNLWIASTDGQLAYRTPQGQLIKIDHKARGFFRFKRLPALGDVLVSELGLMQMDYRLKRLVPVFTDTFLKDIKVRDVVQSSDGLVWIATRSGLFRYDPANKVAYLADKNPFDENALPTNELDTLHISNDGVLWIGTTDKGVVYTNLEGFGFTSYSANNLKRVYPKHDHPDKQNSFKSNMIWGLFRDSRDTLWIGHTEGLSRQQGTEASYTNVAELGRGENRIEIGEEWVMRIIEANGYLWFGTWGKGLIRYDPASEAVTLFSNDTKDSATNISGNVIRLLLFDEKKNVLWVGTHYNSLNRIDFTTGKITKFLHDPSNPLTFPHSRTRALHLDQQGQLWVGSGDGLALFDDATQTFRRVKKFPSGEATTDVRGIYRADDDTLWSATGYGLDRINVNTLEAEEKFLEADGLTRANLYGIINDADGNLWLPTVRGLTRFDPKNRHFDRYFVGHNLQANEFNFNTYLKEKDGSIIVGGVGGITRFKPSEVADMASKAANPLVVLSVKSVDNQLQEREILGVATQTASDEDAFSLAPEQRSIIIDFTIPEYAFAEDLQYEYQLGEQDQWLTATPRDTPIRYTNLDPGKHTFKVRRAGPTAAKSAPLTIHFSIERYWWEQRWFAALMLALLALTGYFVFQKVTAYRLEKQVAHERTDLYSMVVHDLGPALNRSQHDIQTLRRRAEIAPAERNTLLDSLDSDNQYSLSFINQLRSLSTVEGFHNMHKDAFLLEDIVDESVNSFRAEKSRIVVTDIPECSVLTHENSIEFILKNLLSNALKYSKPDTPITLDIGRLREADLLISVQDQGKGISETFKKSLFKPYERGDYYKTEGLGIGLTLVKSIVQKYQGQIKIKKNKPKGTIIEVTLQGVVVEE